MENVAVIVNHYAYY